VFDEPSLRVAIDRVVSRGAEANRKVFCPAREPSVELPNGVLNWYAATPRTGQFADSRSNAFKRFGRWQHILVPPVPALCFLASEYVAKKLKVVSLARKVSDCSLFPIDVQTHPSFERLLDKVLNSLAHICCQDNKVVGIANQLCLCPCSRSILFVEHHIKVM